MPTPAGRCSSPTPTACSSRTTACAPASACSASRSATPVCRSASSRPVAPSGSRSSRRSIPRKSHALPRACAHDAAGAAGTARELPVVLKRGAGGVLFHEACGPASKPISLCGVPVFRGRVGELVVSPLITLVDDGTYARMGHVRDRRRRRGRTAQRAHRRRRAHRLHVGSRARPQAGARCSGNGRRETYQHLPMVRMTNTFLLEGDDDPEAIIGDTEHGLYCVALAAVR